MRKLAFMMVLAMVACSDGTGSPSRESAEGMESPETMVTFQGSLTRFDYGMDPAYACDGTGVPDLAATPVLVLDSRGTQLGQATYQGVTSIDPSVGSVYGCRQDAEYTAVVKASSDYVFTLGASGSGPTPAPVKDSEMKAHNYVWSMVFRKNNTEVSPGDEAYGCFDQSSQKCQDCPATDLTGESQPEYCP